LSFLDGFLQIRQTQNFIQIRAAGAELLHTDGQTDGHDEATIRFPQYDEITQKNCTQLHVTLWCFTVTSSVYDIKFCSFVYVNSTCTEIQNPLKSIVTRATGCEPRITRVAALHNIAGVAGSSLTSQLHQTRQNTSLFPPFPLPRVHKCLELSSIGKLIYT